MIFVVTHFGDVRPQQRSVVNRERDNVIGADLTYDNPAYSLGRNFTDCFFRRERDNLGINTITVEIRNRFTVKFIPETHPEHVALETLIPVVIEKARVPHTREGVSFRIILDNGERIIG